MRPDLEKMCAAVERETGVPRRCSRKCKGPEAGKCLVCARNSKGAGVAGACVCVCWGIVRDIA